VIAINLYRPKRDAEVERLCADHWGIGRMPTARGVPRRISVETNDWMETAERVHRARGNGPYADLFQELYRQGFLEWVGIPNPFLRVVPSAQDDGWLTMELPDSPPSSFPPPPARRRTPRS
jgi:hypothetical protein